jgi:hypothetical protein
MILSWPLHGSVLNFSLVLVVIADRDPTVWNRYHDIMLAAKTNYSLSGRNFNTVVPHELRYQVARNSHHPAIALWDGCNECKLMTPGSAGNRFAKMGMAVVSDVTPVLASCPIER